MGILLVLCFGLLIGYTGAQMINRTAVYPNINANGTNVFSWTSQCQSGTNAYVAQTEYTYIEPSCCPSQSFCFIEAAPPDVDRITAACWTSPNCTVEFPVSNGSCNAVFATIFSLCAPVSPSLAINGETSANGSVVTAAFSTAGATASGGGALWECRVEAWDCSRVSVTLAQVIRNGNVTASYFSLPGASLGELGVKGRSGTFQTPFSVLLNVVPGSELLNAYFAVQAGSPLTVTCGRRPTEPTSSNTPMNVTVLCGRNAGSSKQGVQYQCAACQSSPCQGVASCVPSSGSFQCMCPAGFNSSSDGLACLDINECAATPPPCDVSGHCNNTEGSFHCYCDAGFTLTDNGRGCTGPFVIAAPSPMSVVGPAVGGALGGVVVIFVVVVIVVVVVRHSRRSKRNTAETSRGRIHRTNVPFDHIAPDQEMQPQGKHSYQNVALHASSSSAVTSHADQHYYSMADGDDSGKTNSQLPEQASPNYLTVIPDSPTMTSGSSAVASHADQHYSSVADGVIPSNSDPQLPEQASPNYLTVIPDPPSMTSGSSAVTSHADQHYYNMADTGVPSNAEGAYGRLDPGSRDDVRAANTYQALGATSAGGQSGDVTYNPWTEPPEMTSARPHRTKP